MKLSGLSEVMLLLCVKCEGDVYSGSGKWEVEVEVEDILMTDCPIVRSDRPSDRPSTDTDDAVREEIMMPICMSYDHYV